MNENNWALKILATTDLHMSVCGYDYLSEQRREDIGLTALASIIQRQRAQASSILVDNGDSLQSSPQGDFVAARYMADKTTRNPMIEAMNHLEFDAAAVGNHEFDYGIDYLIGITKVANFPFLCANIHPVNKDIHNWPKPCTIVKRRLKNENGHTVDVKIGLIGLAPTETVNWNWGHLRGRATATEMVQTARAEAQQLRSLGVDLIVLLAHTGVGQNSRLTNHIGLVSELAKINEIDVIVGGHDHDSFPRKYLDGKPDPAIKGTDTEAGTVHGKPVVQPGHSGGCLGVIDLEIAKIDGKIKVSNSRSRLIYPTGVTDEPGKAVENLPSLQKMHTALLVQNREKVAETETPLVTFFEGVVNSCAMALITTAQMEGAKTILRGTKFADYPVISCASAQRIGFGGDVENYTFVPIGPVYRRDIANLYQYPDRLHGIVVTKSELLHHIELAASVFNQIQPGQHDQPLFDPRFSLYTHNRFLGVNYTIDPAQPARFNPDFSIANPKARRVRNVTLNGQEIPDDQEFILVMNTYRAGGGGNVFNLNLDDFIFQSDTTIPEMLVAYLSSLPGKLCVFAPNWVLENHENTSAFFKTSAKAIAIMEKYDRNDLSVGHEFADGFARFRFHFRPSK